MEINSYSVVEFPCEDDSDSTEVEVVPYLWLFEDSDKNKKCYWPNVKSSERISRLVSTRAVPAENWRICNVTRIFGTYADYLEARSKANRAVDTSDINTDAETRKRFVKKRPLIGGSAVENRPNPKKAIRVVQDSSDEDVSDLETLPMTPPSLPPRPGTSTMIRSSTSTPVVVAKKKTNVPTNSCPPTPTSDSGSRMSTTDSTSLDFDQPGTEFERQVKRDLFGVKIRLTQIESTLNLILSKLNQKSSESPAWLTLPFKFPVRSLQEFQDLESKLMEESFQTQLVDFFVTMGGNSPADMTRRVLRKIMTDSVATQINWRGHNGKFAFEKTRVSELVTVGVQSFYGQGSTKANAKIVEDTAKEWLKQAKNRIKHRKERQTSRPMQAADSNESE